MATIKQIDANRLNSQKSTGPRSVEGKARSSQNALKSGIDAESLIILGEDRAALETLTQEYVERFHPTTPEQRYYVDILIRDDWQLRRLAKVDTQIWKRELISPLKYNQNAPLGSAYACGSTTFSRLQRRMDCAERSYQRALRELHHLQVIEEEVVAQASACDSLRPPQIGFVPQKPAQQSAQPFDPTLLYFAPPSRDLTLPYTIVPANFFETPYRGFPK